MAEFLIDPLEFFLAGFELLLQLVAVERVVHDFLEQRTVQVVLRDVIVRTHLEGRDSRSFGARARHYHHGRREFTVFFLQSLKQTMPGGVSIVEVQENTVHSFSIKNVEGFLGISSLVDFNVVSELAI